MTNQVFFSFDYQDVIDFRANVVRNHWCTKTMKEKVDFLDASIWESEKVTEEYTLKKIINVALQETNVTVVLIGSETYKRRWVRYEMVRSLVQGNKLIAVHINSIKDKYGNTKPLGPNPLDYVAYMKYKKKKVSFFECKNDRWLNYKDYIPFTLENSDIFPIQNEMCPLSLHFPVYDWVLDVGYHNFSQWIK